MLMQKSIFFMKSSVKINSRALTMLSEKAYVNGKWITGTQNRKFEVENPADGSIVGSVPNLNAEEVSRAIDSASETFQTWRKTTPKQRSDLLRKWYNLLNKRAKEIAEIVTAESGKPIIESIGEVSYANSFIEWFAEEARRIYGEVATSQTPSKELIFIKQPIGVVSLITPWNFPAAMITRKAGAVLAAGCTCVIKPAEDTPFTALAMVRLAEEAGFPPGVINVVTCDLKNAPEVGNVMCTHPKVAGLSFTGSTNVGKILYSQCSRGIKRIGLELGGNAPFIVFDSANIDEAVKGAMGSKYRNCGQTCVSANRFLVQEKVVEEFTRKLVEKVESLKIGNGKHNDVNLGPLINEAQFKKVSSLVDDAVSKGAKVLKGGAPLPNIGKFFYAPTVLTNITSDMMCYHQEVFGPISQIIPFKTEEEALQIANATNSGLAGYFYSENINQVWRVAKELQVGMVGINEGIISCAEAAFGGVKESGIGREGSHYGVDEFINVKYLCFGGLS